jgi:hypothetical protein
MAPFAFCQEGDRMEEVVGRRVACGSQGPDPALGGPATRFWAHRSRTPGSGYRAPDQGRVDQLAR